MQVSPINNLSRGFTPKEILNTRALVLNFFILPHTFALILQPYNAIEKSVISVTEIEQKSFLT